jgi:group I intron endonuclease
MRTGIYQIRNLVDDKRYIGSAAAKGGFANRWGAHRCKLRQHNHHNRYLQNAWNKYGEDAFTFEILLYCDSDDCITFEQMAIDCYEPEYNICRIAGSPFGRKHSDETRAKLRSMRLGKGLSEATKLKLSQAHRGKRASDATKLKMSMSQKGKHDGLNAAILDAQKVMKIKDLLRKDVSQKDIAKRFGVDPTTISSIKTGKTWRKI